MSKGTIGDIYGAKINWTERVRGKDKEVVVTALFTSVDKAEGSQGSSRNCLIKRFFL